MKGDKLKNIKSSGFKVPDNYFKSFDDKMIKKIEEETILEKHMKSGFKSPEGFFESFDNKVLDTLSHEKNSKVISFISKKQVIYLSGIAAAIMILLTLNTKESNLSFETLSLETVENYILDENISSYEIASLLSDEQLHEGINIQYDFNDENLEEYLLENADIEELITE